MFPPSFRVVGLCLAVGICTVLSPVVADAPADKPSAELSRQTDKQLREALEAANPGAEDEPTLAEVVRRGGDEWQTWLAERHAEFLQRRKLPDGAEGAVSRWASNLELLTAWRRVQKKNDPLRILIAGELERSYQLDESPHFTALIVNLDDHKETVHGFKHGGNDRSGRFARWRFEVRDERGRLLPILDPPNSMGGGIFSSGPLEFEESWQAEFRLKDYVVIPAPGRYTLRLYYHNQDPIDDDASIDERITSRSREIKIEIRPLRISVTAEERKKIRDWIGGLPEKGPVKILMDGLISNPKVLDPESPAGQLYRAREDAIPDLVDAAVDPKLLPDRRAWVLGILFGITGYNDPRGGFLSGIRGVLGSYEYEAENGRGSASGGAMDAKKQADFAERWRVWKSGDYFTLEER